VENGHHERGHVTAEKMIVNRFSHAAIHKFVCVKRRGRATLVIINQHKSINKEKTVSNKRGRGQKRSSILLESGVELSNVVNNEEKDISHVGDDVNNLREGRGLPNIIREVHSHKNVIARCRLGGRRDFRGGWSFEFFREIAKLRGLGGLKRGSANHFGWVKGGERVSI